MSDQWSGPGWWLASDGKWYPPADAPNLQNAGAVVAEENEDRFHDLASDAVPDSAQDPVAEAQDPVEEDSHAELTFMELDASSELREVHEEQPKLDELEALNLTDADVIDLNEVESESTSPELAMASAKVPADAAGSVGGGAYVGSTLTQGEEVLRSEVESVSVGGASDLSPDSNGHGPSSISPESEVVGSEAAGLDEREGGDESLEQAVGPAGSSRSSIIFSVALALALLSGILGALFLQERSQARELRAELAALAGERPPEIDLTDLEDALNTARVQNQQLEQQLADMSALVLQLPEGRLTEISAPLDPVFADEASGRLIAVDAVGDYVIWGDGADSPITDSGSLGAAPTGMFAGGVRAWVTTEAGEVVVLPMVLGTEVQPTVQYGPLTQLVPDVRGYWAYNSELGQVVRLERSDGEVTNAIDLPVPVVDLTIGAGSVWALGDDGLVYRINTADFTLQSFNLGADLISVTAGPDALWTLSAADGSLRRVDPVTGSVLVTVPVGRDPIDAMFAGSSVWVGLRAGSSMIEVDTATSAVVSRTELSSEPAQLYEGDTGVYVSTVGEGSPLLRIDSLAITADLAEQAEQAAEEATDQ